MPTIGSVVCFAELASIGFYIGFPVLWLLLLYLLLIPCFTTCILFHQSPILIFSYHEYFLFDTTCLISTCSCMPMLTTRFSMHDYDSVLSIHLYLSQHAIWLLPHHSPGEFWLLWILMSRSWSLERVDCPSCLPEMRSGSVDHQQTDLSYILPGPLCASRVFLL